MTQHVHTACANAAGLIALLLALSAPVAAATLTVTKTADTGDGVCDSDCSLREALAAAQDGDLINFSSLFNAPQTIDLLTALPVINRNISIQGPGAQLLDIRRAQNAATEFRIFTIAAGIANGVAISRMTMSNGRASQGNGFGGGIESRSRLTLNGVHVTGNTGRNGGGVGLIGAPGVFSNSTFSNNMATDAVGGGGGIMYEAQGAGTLRLVNCTVSGNRSANNGGGISNNAFFANSPLELINSTVVSNTAAAVFSGGGGIFGIGDNGRTASQTLRNVIVSGNSPNNFEPRRVNNGVVSFQSLGFNLSNNYNNVFTLVATDITQADPRLASLDLNGGQTPTHALLFDSPALDRGDSSGETADQRGAIRPLDVQGVANAADGADIGAFELDLLFRNGFEN